MIKKFLAVLLVAILLGAFSKTYQYSNIDGLAFVVAIAVDTSEHDKLSVSLQFISPSGVTQTGSTEEQEIILHTADASSISNAINLLDTHQEKEISLSHCKLVVFSEEIARRGIADEIYSFINNPQVRPNTNLVVSTTSAKEFLENSKPELGNLVSTFYDTFPKSGEFTGIIAESTLSNFFNDYIGKTSEPYAILGGVHERKGNTVWACLFQG